VRYEFLLQEVNHEDPFQFNEKHFGRDGQPIDISVGISGLGPERSSAGPRYNGRFECVRF
jgi:hypothetical protein